MLLSMVVVTTVGLGSSGCAAETGPGVGGALGKVEVRVTDAPASANVTSIMVTASSVEIHKAVAEQAGELERVRPNEGDQVGQQGQDKEQKSNGAQGKQRAPGQGGGDQTGEQQLGKPEDQGGAGWLSLAIPEGANSFDLIKIKGIEEVLATGDLEVGKYTQLRLVIDKVEVTLGGNKTQEAIVPSGVLKFVGPFDVVAGETTIILLDFDAEKSVTVTGAGKILVRPVVKLTVQQGAASPQAESGEQILVDASYTGQEVVMAVGDRLVVTLESNPTTGFKWELAEGTDQTVLELVESRYQPGPGASQTPPVPGAGGEEVWTFQALKQGETAISLEYSQPWAGGLKADRTFNLTVEVD